MNKPDNHILTIFGASGDLTKRKLVPEIYELKKQNLLPDKFAILGIGRKELSDEAFRNKMYNAILEFNNIDNKENVKEFVKNFYFQTIDTKSADDYAKVKSRIEGLVAEYSIDENVIFYLSTPPSLYGIIPEYLGKHNLANEDKGWKRIIVEKPFGYDLQSAIELNKSIKQSFHEDQIYRIDHYLGKETVQNLLVTRFSNGIFEPLWNRNFVQHIEITSAESLGVENRGGYYDSSGAVRDMIQNHLLQIVALVAMEPPSSIESNSIRNEMLKVFHSLRPIENIKEQVIRGQYVSSKIKGEAVQGYREEEGVDPNSKTETYAAVKFYIDNWRWGGIPFYVRHGKRLPTKVTEVVVHFKPTPHSIFKSQSLGEACNRLVIRIQPDEGILLKFGMKVPGQGFSVQNVNMDFHYKDLSNVHLASAYERLLHDCMVGDSTLYARGDAVEAAWEFIDPILKNWKDDNSIPLFGYPAGTWGPENADDLIEGAHLTWRYPCKNLSDDGSYCEL